MLTFEEVGHVYRLDGVVIPSVTFLLAKLHSFASVPEDVLEAARERGTAVHLATQYWDEGDLDEDTLDERTRGYLQGWRKFRAESGCTIVEIEERGLHPVHRYAGTWDRALLIAGVDWTIDIKTAIAPHWCFGLQVAAYAALRGRPGSKRGTVQLRADGTYRFREWTSPTDWPAFVSLITLHNISEKHRNGNA